MSPKTRGDVPAYLPFHVEVSRTVRLSPSFVRVTFAGDTLCDFADNGLDQRINVILPHDGADFGFCAEPDWYQAWRSLPPPAQPPLRTYTVREVRPRAGELDVDFVLHGDGGPASRWVGAAVPGDRLVVVGPNARCPEPTGAVEWAPPPGADRLLLAGDETAVPAISVIAAALTPAARGRILLEVPEPDDELPLAAPPGVEVAWLPRTGAQAHGDLLVPAVQEAVRALAAPAQEAAGRGPESLDDLEDVDEDELWEIPETPGGDGFYAWLAGEAGMVRRMRRHLVQDAGVDRSSVAFMGYWRLGRPPR
ncbi:siderophore-interacting protein [Microtetraspora sp. NBRC 13810]|uniref:siderophore-interacting protein n=1 Tax=Microtetraspora sp. NBRC 13810 TaxID=3030990 RepID=UPI0024A5B05F|nr:siderophore-interacting protein [Microtetraspora sp. NBRC 13810]GLW11029.1 siderophore-interacting protein [Microtetraspora sp. NBRC 13810]